MPAVKGEQFWSKHNVPASLNWCGSAITEAFTTRAAHFYNRYESVACIPKGRLCSPEQVLLSSDRKDFCGEICEKLSPVRGPVAPLDPEVGWKMSARYILVFFPPLQKWCMVSSEEIRGKVHLCPAQITSGGRGGALNLGSHVMLLFGRRPRNGIHGLVLKKGNDDFRTKLKVRSCPKRWGGCCVVNLGVNH